MSTMKESIVIDSNIQHGKPVIGGTRVPVARVLGSIASGMSIDEVMEEYGSTTEDVQAALQFAAETSQSYLSNRYPPIR